MRERENERSQTFQTQTCNARYGLSCCEAKRKRKKDSWLLPRVLFCLRHVSQSEQIKLVPKNNLEAFATAATIFTRFSLVDF